MEDVQKEKYPSENISEAFLEIQEWLSIQQPIYYIVWLVTMIKSTFTSYFIYRKVHFLFVKDKYEVYMF